MEPPEFYPPSNTEGARVGEAQQNVLLEVLNYCRFLHAAVQRIEQKIDGLRPGISEKPTVQIGGAQLSRSLARRLGPSPQTKAARNPRHVGNVAPRGAGGKRNKRRRRRARRAVVEEEEGGEEVELGDRAAEKKSEAKRRRKKRKRRTNTAATPQPVEAVGGDQKKKSSKSPFVVTEK